MGCEAAWFPSTLPVSEASDIRALPTEEESGKSHTSYRGSVRSLVVTQCGGDLGPALSASSTAMSV
jgi:hypothetical protein